MTKKIKETAQKANNESIKSVSKKDSCNCSDVVRDFKIRQQEMQSKLYSMSRLLRQNNIHHINLEENFKIVEFIVLVGFFVVFVMSVINFIY